MKIPIHFITLAASLRKHVPGICQCSVHRILKRAAHEIAKQGGDLNAIAEATAHQIAAVDLVYDLCALLANRETMQTAIDALRLLPNNVTSTENLVAVSDSVALLVEYEIEKANAEDLSQLREHGSDPRAPEALRSMIAAALRDYDFNRMSETQPTRSVDEQAEIAVQPEVVV